MREAGGMNQQISMNTKRIEKPRLVRQRNPHVNVLSVSDASLFRRIGLNLCLYRTVVWYSLPNTKKNIQYKSFSMVIDIFFQTSVGPKQLHNYVYDTSIPKTG